MLPHEVQENIVKVLFFVFAVSILCFSKARAVESTVDFHSTTSFINSKYLK